MTINIPENIPVECPNCNYVGHSIDEMNMTTCGNCGLMINKDELLETNKDRITEIVKNEIQKDLKKRFKSLKFK